MQYLFRLFAVLIAKKLYAAYPVTEGVSIILV